MYYYRNSTRSAIKIAIASAFGGRGHIPLPLWPASYAARRLCRNSVMIATIKYPPNKNPGYATVLYSPPCVNINFDCRSFCDEYSRWDKPGLYGLLNGAEWIWESSWMEVRDWEVLHDSSTLSNRQSLHNHHSCNNYRLCIILYNIYTQFFSTHYNYTLVNINTSFNPDVFLS